MFLVPCVCFGVCIECKCGFRARCVCHGVSCARSRCQCVFLWRCVFENKSSLHALWISEPAGEPQLEMESKDKKQMKQTTQ